VTLPGVEKEGWARVGIPLREKNQGISSSGIGDTGGGILLAPLIKFVRACSRSTRERCASIALTLLRDASSSHQE